MSREKRMGLIVPAGNRTIEPDFYTTFSRNVTVHSTRKAAHSGVETEAGMDAFNATIETACSELIKAQVDVIAYGFTTASFYRGGSYNQQLIQRISQAAGVPAVTPSTAIVKALRALRAKRIFIITPYTEWNNTVLLRYLVETEFEVAGLQGDDRAPEEALHSPMWHQEPEDILRRVSSTNIPSADAVVFPCTAWRTVEIIEELEQITGLPVVTANQASIWETASLLGDRIPDESKLGKLFEIR